MNPASPELWVADLARLAEGFGLIQFPAGFYGWDETRRAEWCALEICRIKHRAEAGDKKAATFFEAYRRWLQPPAPFEGPPPGTADRELILVLGLHGSLSSCLALCLERMGVWMGRAPAGGEDQPLAAMCERLMPYPRSEFTVGDSFIDEELSEWLAGFLAAAPARGPIGAKYPTLLALAERLTKLQKQIKLVVMDRPLDESIMSRLDRNETHSEGCQPWQIEQVQHRLWAVREAFLADREHYRVDVSKLLSEPLETLQGLAQWLGLDVGEATLAEAAQLVQPVWARNQGKRPPPRKKLPGDWCRDTTIVTTAFERPRCLETFVPTCHDYFPEAEILVADSSRKPATCANPRVRIISMPNDAGISAGRNRLFDEVDTPYVLLADDDSVFTGDTDIQQLADLLTASDYDMVAGTVQQAANSRPRRFYGHFIERSNGRLRASHGPIPETDPPRYDLVVNFYLARTDVMRRIRYRDDLKVGEHLEFFLRAWKAGVKIGRVPEVIIVDQTQSRGIYGRMRKRARAMQEPAIIEWLASEGYRRFSLQFGEGPGLVIRAG